MPLSVIILSLGAFAIGLTEFISVGIIPVIAKTYHITESSAGMVSTIYALGVTVGAPLLTLTFVNINKKHLLLLAMIAFGIFNSIAGLTTNYHILLTARFLSGMFHGLYFGIGATVATRLVDKSKVGAAIATMFGGLTIAIALGVPVGSYLTDYFGYSFAYLVVSFIAILSAIGSLLLIPNTISDIDEKMPLKNIGKLSSTIIKDKKLMLSYALTTVIWGVTFIAYTFVSPILRDIAHINTHYISIFLLIFGAGVALGNIFGGKLSDSLGERKALLIKTSSMTIFYILLYFLITSNIYIVGIMVFLWGFISFSIVPSLQSAVMNIASNHNPQVVGVASAFNISAFNIGITVFSYLGAYIMTHYGVIQTLPVSIVTVIIGLALVGVFYKVTENK